MKYSIIKPITFCKVNVYDISRLLNTLKENNIIIYDLKKINSYTYSFYFLSFHHKKVIKLVPNIEIIKKQGILNYLFNLLKYKTTIVSLIISSLFYYNLSSKIWIINIVGDNLDLTEFISESLKDNNIYIGSKKKSNEQISSIQNKILYENYDIIEYLSLNIKGCKVDVNYKEKRKGTTIDNNNGNLYASKDGMIKSFDLISGNKVVNINDYVKKGDLLVKDVITTDYNQDIYVGSKGKVYAYTWYYVVLENKIDFDIDDLSLFSNSLLYAKEKLSINFSNDEYIYEENVMNFKIEDNNLYMKIHFTCIENIAINNIND